MFDIDKLSQGEIDDIVKQTAEFFGFDPNNDPIETDDGEYPLP